MTNGDWVGFPVQLGSMFGEPHLHYLPETSSLGGNNISVPLHSLDPYVKAVHTDPKLPVVFERKRSTWVCFYCFTFKSSLFIVPVNRIRQCLFHKIVL